MANKWWQTKNKQKINYPIKWKRKIKYVGASTLLLMTVLVTLDFGYTRGPNLSTTIRYICLLTLFWTAPICANIWNKRFGIIAKLMKVWILGLMDLVTYCTYGSPYPKETCIPFVLESNVQKAEPVTNNSRLCFSSFTSKMLKLMTFHYVIDSN